MSGGRSADTHPALFFLLGPGQNGNADEKTSLGVTLSEGRCSISQLNSHQKGRGQGPSAQPGAARHGSSSPWDVLCPSHTRPTLAPGLSSPCSSVYTASPGCVCPAPSSHSLLHRDASLTRQACSRYFNSPESHRCHRSSHVPGCPSLVRSVFSLEGDLRTAVCFVRCLLPVHSRCASDME